MLSVVQVVVIETESLHEVLYSLLVSAAMEA